MKKILITGVTRMHVRPNHFEKSELNIQTSVTALIKGLQMLGYEVEQREVVYGENLNKYHRIITYINSSSSMVNISLCGALWTLTRPDTIIGIDDAYSGNCFIDPISNGVERKYKDMLKHQIKCDVSKYKQDIDKLHEDWVYGRHFLLPLWEGGDKSVFFKNKYNKEYASITGFDPNPLLPLRIGKSSSNKKREWLVAALSKPNRTFMRKYKLKYPLIEAGERRKGALRLREAELVDKFGETWFNGVSKIAWSAGGWWRLRTQQIKDVGSICWHQSQEEAALFGPSWVIPNPLTLEDLTDIELVDLAAQMKIEFDERHPINQFGLDRSLSRIKNFITI